MSNLRIGDGLFFKRGIDSITQKTNQKLENLVLDNHELPPAEQGQRPQLDGLLNQPDSNSFLEAKLCPEFEDRELLLPSKFQRALDDSLAFIEQKLSEKHATDPLDNSSKIMNRAARVLREDSELRDLLRMYRAALLQG
jgi:type III secretion protein X